MDEATYYPHGEFTISVSVVYNVTCDDNEYGWEGRIAD